MNTQNQTTEFEHDAELKRLDSIADILDNSIPIPFTDFRFGLDSIIGLIPYVGDVAGFAISSYLLSIMARRGAGIGIMLRMMGNTLLDALVGIIPFVGDLFDIGFKANRRNVDMLKNYYADGKKKPPAKRSAAILGILFLIVFIFLLIGVWKFGAFIFATAWAFIKGFL